MSVEERVAATARAFVAIQKKEAERDRQLVRAFAEIGKEDEDRRRKEDDERRKRDQCL